MKRQKRTQKRSMGSKMPTLQDLKKTVPKGGLLNPGLRKGFGSRIPKR